MFCSNCGTKNNEEAKFCRNCGANLQMEGADLNSAENEGERQNVEGSNQQFMQRQSFSEPPKDWLTTLLLSIFLGSLGVHRFYTGHIAIGIVQILTLGGCGIWSLIDIIMIATGSFKDSYGRPLTRRDAGLNYQSNYRKDEWRNN